MVNPGFSFLALVNDSTCVRVWIALTSHGITSRSRTAFTLSEISLEREAALPVSFLSTPLFARISNVVGFSWVSDELVRGMVGRAVFVTENDVFLGEMGVHSRANGSRVRISRVADDEIVPVGFAHAKRSVALHEI